MIEYIENESENECCFKVLEKKVRFLKTNKKIFNILN